jgi:hypothetical protein
LDVELRDIEREARLARQIRERHWTMLGLSLAIVAGSFILRTGDADHVAPIGFPQLSLPPLCGSRAIFCVECPGCGLTRSFVALASGDVAESFRFHRVGWVIALAVVAQLPYRVYGLWELRTGVVERKWPIWFGYALIALLIVNWLVKIAGL